MRIHKLLSSEGVLSRRKAEDYIAQGRVTVNGRRATIGQDVRPGRDIIAVDGVKVEFDRKRRRHYIALNKPRGYVSTMEDELGRRCVADLVKDIGARVYPIGRLDRESEGLLLLTDDGEFANLIMHPSKEVNKSYRTTITGPVTEDQIIALSVGVDIGDDYTTAPAQVDVITREPGRTVLRITIHEGKNRQIRRMCEAVGLQVARLKRTSVGPVQLGMLQPGKWRDLTAQEIGAMRAAVKTLNRASIAAEKQKDDRRPSKKTPTRKPASGKPGAGRPGSTNPAPSKTAPRKGSVSRGNKA